MAKRRLNREILKFVLTIIFGWASQVGAFGKSSRAFTLQ